MKLFTNNTPQLTPSAFSLQSIQSCDSDFFCTNQLSIIFIEAGYGKGKINNEVFEFSAPGIICLNETEHLNLNKNARFQGKVLTFPPSSIKPYFTFKNLRMFEHNFTPEDIHLVLQLSVFFQRFPEYNGYLPASEPIMKQLNKTLEELHRCTEMHHLTSSVLTQIILPIKRLVQTHLSVSKVIITETTFEVKDVLIYLHNNCNQKITIPTLSKTFHVNRTTLSDRFFEATGETIITYLNKYRINLAAIMLRESTLSISAIAEEVGFNDTAYFAKLFKKYMFHTPSGYRQRYVSLCQIHKVEEDVAPNES